MRVIPFAGLPKVPMRSRLTGNSWMEKSLAKPKFPISCRRCRPIFELRFRKYRRRCQVGSSITIPHRSRMTLIFLAKRWTTSDSMTLKKPLTLS